eukprot:comp18244_c0_seq1/m.19214 comp18244_c0_seq1/g.19214  ORF comp18244_c0_seq1/g.19214 comp18244_c0_seq1/m.19214 type:complete len:121 (-) comp18244_c0_seq1:434-796(-)
MAGNDPQDAVPSSMRELRACMLCSLIKTHDQFYQDGCNNCEAWLKLRGDRMQIDDCTSKNFEGVISLMQPDQSWVAQWQRISKMTKGCYAISVSGQLPPKVVDDLEADGIMYMSRDIHEN